MLLFDRHTKEVLHLARGLQVHWLLQTMTVLSFMQLHPQLLYLPLLLV